MPNTTLRFHRWMLGANLGITEANRNRWRTDCCRCLASGLVRMSMLAFEPLSTSRSSSPSQRASMVAAGMNRRSGSTPMWAAVVAT